MCRWRRYFWSCGHAEFLLFGFCNDAELLPAAYVKKVLDLRCDNGNSTAAVSSEQTADHGMEELHRWPRTRQQASGQAENPPQDTTSITQAQDEELGCIEDDANNANFQNDLTDAELAKLRSSLAYVQPDFHSHRRHESLRRHSTPEFSELDILVDQVDMMKEELLRLRNQAEHEHHFTNAYSSRRLSQTSDGRGQTHHEETKTNTHSPRGQTTAPVLQPPKTRSLTTDKGESDARRPSYADALARGHDAGRNALVTHEAVATVTGQQRTIHQTPRFAQPTEATTRRVDETLRKQTVPVMSTINEKTSPKLLTGRNKSTSPPASRLPKRTSLPGSWLSASSNEAAKAPVAIAESMSEAAGQSSDLPSPKKGTSPPYMSPTKATMRRENELLQTNTAQKKAPTVKKRLVTSKQQTDSTTLALAEVNAMSRRLSKASEPQEPSRAVANAVTRRRTSNSDILAPIFKKLDRQGLLKDDSTVLESVDTNVKDIHQQPAPLSPSASNAKKSYADVLRPLAGHEMPAMRGQTSAEIGRALLARAQSVTPEAREAVEPVITNSFHSGADQARVIIPSSSTLAVPDDIESISLGTAQIASSELRAAAEISDFPPMSSITAHAVSDASPIRTPRQGPRSLSLDAVQQCDASDMLRSASSRLNAAAASFVPQATLFSTSATPMQPAQPTDPVSVLPALAARGAIDDDVFKMLPRDEWDSMTREEKAHIRLLRKEKMQEYYTPLAWRKNQMTRSWAKQQQFQTLPLSGDTMSDSSPSSSTWSAGQQRQGWNITAADGGPSWSGGKGREIRFRRQGPDAERHQEPQYVYTNRDTGRSLHISRPYGEQPAPRDWAAELDALNRLQAAIQRGYPKVPCAKYDTGPHFWQVVPVPCSTCCSAGWEHQ